METSGHFVRAFRYLDKENIGHLNKHQLKVFYVCLFGYRPSAFELNNILGKYGKSKINNVKFDEEIVVDKEELYNYVTGKLKYTDKYDEMREIFQNFDMQCKGFIDFEDFKKAARLKYPNMEDLKMQKFFRELDKNSDNKVSFHDFVLMMENGDNHMFS